MIAGNIHWADFWKLLQYVGLIRPETPESTKSAGKGGPDPPDIVEQPQGIGDFRSRGGGPVGHPQSVLAETRIFNMKYLPKASHVQAMDGAGNRKKTKVSQQLLKKQIREPRPASKQVHGEAAHLF